MRRIENESFYFKKANETFKKELIDLSTKNVKDRSSVNEQDETLAYLFNRTKKVASLISEFYYRVYGIKDSDCLTGNNTLSCEVMQERLEKILRDYEDVLKGNKGLGHSVDTRDTDTIKFSISSNSQRERRPLSINISPHPERIYRSKSPFSVYTTQTNVFTPRGLPSSRNLFTDSRGNIHTNLNN